LNHYLGKLARSRERAMEDLGNLGQHEADEKTKEQTDAAAPAIPAAGIAALPRAAGGAGVGLGDLALKGGNPLSFWNLPSKPPPPSAAAGPTIRNDFANGAYWSVDAKTNADGVAEFALTMPDKPAVWKIKVWAMGHGTKVGQGEAEIVTRK
jgi:hypothetical protein